MVLLAEIPVLVLFGKLPINISFAATFIYIFYYLLLEPVAGVQLSDRPSLILRLFSPHLR